MTYEPKPTPDDLTPAQPTEDDEGPTGKTLIDPFTGERIFSPKRAKLIEEDLERMKEMRERRQGKQAEE